MKKYLFYVMIFLTIIILGYYCCLHFEEKNSLTKEYIWSIINNIDGTLLGIMAKNGEKELSETSKLDYILKYIIKNKEQLSDNILSSNSMLEKDNTIYYNFGKVEENYFSTLLYRTFENFDYDLKNSYVYNDDYIELYYEPIEYISCDLKQISSYYIYKGNIYMYVKYFREIGEMKNNFIVKYVFNKNTYKIVDIVILNSKMN